MIAGRIDAAGVANRARVIGFDGQTALGEIRLAAWDDDFAVSHRVKGYQPPRGLDCRLTAK